MSTLHLEHCLQLFSATCVYTKILFLRLYLSLLFVIKIGNMQLTSAMSYYIIPRGYKLQSSPYIKSSNRTKRKAILLRDNWAFWGTSHQGSRNSVRNVPEVWQFFLLYTKSISSLNIYVRLFSPSINALVIKRAPSLYFRFHSNFLSLHFLLT